MACSYEMVCSLATQILGKCFWKEIKKNFISGASERFYVCTCTFLDVLTSHLKQKTLAMALKLWNQLLLAIRQSNSLDSVEKVLKTYLLCESSFF